MSPSTSRPDADANTGDEAAPVQFPTETEIYLLPDGTVVIADMPEELAPLAAALGAPEPCHIHGQSTRGVREHA